MKNKYSKAKFIDVFKYSFGGLGSNLAFFLVMSYLTFFYTDIFGINTMVVSGLMLISRFIDAFTDPIMGMLSDHTHSKMGKYRPWIIGGAPLLGLFIFLLFTAPEMSPNMKIVYVYVIYITYSLVSTVVNIPYHSLTPVMSQDPDQRTVIVSWKQGMGTVAQFIVTIMALPLVDAFGGGKQGWAIYGALVGIMTTVSFWVCAWGGKKYDVCDMQRERVRLNMVNDLKLLVKNKPMLMLMIAFGTDVLANATYSAVNMYYFKYVLNRVDLVPKVASATLFAGIILLPLLPAIAKFVGKKRLYWLGSLFSIYPLIVMWLHPTASVTILMSMMAVFGFVSRIPSNLGWAMLPECSDFGEWKFGQRSDGLMSSSLTFINKFGMAIGGFIASFFLGIVGFTANQEQTPQVLDMIVFLRFGMPVIGYVASLISMALYEITDEKYLQIRSELDEK
ncbi:glycoside-pentoside-hexuronide (GPH):cation symporter [Clostridium boliviensis]|uniref:Glycoside-pentoside-hexuronide (GPH):cation symporter n=1 Tax=Clostridium boliviensis TaxID=318465 RepID=A0ABU4GRR5_9CLOT|nr:glycoside-pentoside-hexuronide (GPH):cation symporter [Clostridium boliviensis]MDW2798882.1 glycoside-pentoside-hexuronide (GPH):cation symporter [Clostridium boliviensis]